MEKRLNCVLLIDDNADDNFIHERVLRKSGRVSRIVTEETASRALISLGEKGGVRPDLIFLDINMPGMNGWEFLNEYAATGEPKSPVIILTTSRNPDDENKAGKYGCVWGFRSKPLTGEALLNIMDTYFN